MSESSKKEEGSLLVSRKYISMTNLVEKKKKKDGASETSSHHGGSKGRSKSASSAGSSKNTREREIAEMDRKMKDMHFLRDIHFSHPMSLGVCVGPPMFFPDKLNISTEPSTQARSIAKKLKEIKGEMANPQPSQEEIIKSTKWPEDAVFTSESRAEYIWKLQSALSRGVLPFCQKYGLKPASD